MLGWLAFTVLIATIMILDLGVFNHPSKQESFKRAVGFSLFCVACALIFGGGVWYFKGPGLALEFLTGYLVEEALSIDNIFIFLVIFSYFKVPPKLQRTALFWGILGALLMRAVFIVCGISLIERFHWILYFFGALLVFTGLRMAFKSDENIQPENNPVLKLLRKLVPVTDDYHGHHFWIRQAGRWVATPLFVVVVVVETTDLMFAVDSIPAVLAITRDPFIVFTSNVFAIMGLRAMFFALAGAMNKFHLLNYGLAAVLCFVGGKMLLEHWINIPIGISLGVIAGVLAVTVGASLLFPKR